MHSSRESGSPAASSGSIMRNGVETLFRSPMEAIATLAVGLLVMLALSIFTLREAARRRLDAAGVKVLPWRPHLILRIYRSSHRNLLESVRCVSAGFPGLAHVL